MYVMDLRIDGKTLILLPLGLFHSHVRRPMDNDCSKSHWPLPQVNSPNKKKAKLDLRGVRQPPGVALRRRPSHAGRENP